ncbi:MAG: HDOD domain-containing protein [Chitinispirillaceae bacterium]|nr:HDOD domain-containing protein [Chitinispirillaceae bacterium]
MAKRKRIPGLIGADNTGPMLLLFSPRERMREILTVGLVQCNYQILQAGTSYLAGIKASQMLPTLVIADLSADNPKDVLLVARIHKSVRTKSIAIILIVPAVPDPFVTKVLAEVRELVDSEGQGAIAKIPYPFAFADLLAKIKSVASETEHQIVNSNSEEFVNRAVAERLFDLSVKNEKKLQDIGSVLNKNWGFPFTVIKALDILESDGGCCTELAKCISTDPAVSSTILKISNTVLFARRSGRINDVRDAVVRMGFRETRSILACLSLIDLSPEVYRNRGFGRREFWLHSLAVGLIAEKLCTGCKFPRPELAFMAGLLHDLGKIPLDNNFETVFPKLLDHTMDSFSAFYESEETLMGFTHAQLGHFLTTQWNFPSVISMAILNHHEKERILHASPAFDKLIQEAVFVANQLAKAAAFGHSCDEIIEEIPAEMMRDLKLSAGPSERFFNSILNELKQLCSYLNLQLQERHFVSDAYDTQDCDIILVYDVQSIYHPMIVALRNNGFSVRQTTKIASPSSGKKRVIISIPERGLPLDIMFYGEEQKAEGSEVLKIFLVDMEQSQTMRENICDTNLLFMDRKTFDVRLLIHTLDTFFERIILPDLPGAGASAEERGK